MKIKYVVGIFLAAGISIAAISLAVASQQAYVTFNDAAEDGGDVQVKGTWVKEMGSSYDDDRNVFIFTMADEQGSSFPVEYHGAKPNNFEMAEEVVVGGRYDGQKFVATSLLTKCPSKYEAETIDVGEGY